MISVLGETFCGRKVIRDHVDEPGQRCVTVQCHGCGVVAGPLRLYNVRRQGCPSCSKRKAIPTKRASVSLSESEVETGVQIMATLMAGGDARTAAQTDSGRRLYATLVRMSQRLKGAS